MSPEVRELVEKLERDFGGQVVLRILQAGFDSFAGDVNSLNYCLTSLDSPFVQRVTELLAAEDPDAVWRVIERPPPDGLQIVVVGRLPSDFEPRLRAEFDKLFEAYPGFRERHPARYSFKYTSAPCPTESQS